MDPISNMIVQLKNAGEVGNQSVTLPYSKYKESILETLLKLGYVKSFAKKGKKVAKQIEVELAYVDGAPKIKGVERVSKMSKRMYTAAKNLRSVKHGFGSVILTTPNGILTDKEAKAAKVGGEPLFKIW